MGLLGKKGPSAKPPSTPIQPPMRQPSVQPASHTIIGRSSTLEGDLHCGETVRVFGTVKGSIEGQQEVIVESSGRVEGNIQANSVIISGSVKGNVEGLQSVELRAQGELQGDIVTEKVVIAEGAKFQGRVDMQSPLKGQKKPDTEKAKGEEKPKKGEKK